MLAKGVRWAALIALAVASVTGCQTRTSTSPKVDPDASQATSTMDAAGGLATWRQCRQFEVTGVVIAYQEDDSVYLTEHTFHVSPWSHVISISAHEPQSNYVWQLVGHQFLEAEGDPKLDVSQLRQDYQDYAEAILEIMTAPVRLLEWDAKPAVNPTVPMIGGRPYDVIEAGSPTGVERAYYRDENSSQIDMIWLADKDRTHFMMVRGYDYASLPPAGVQVPTKIELFRSDPSRQIGFRLAQIDVRRMGW
jgi:hypothetical protein